MDRTMTAAGILNGADGCPAEGRALRVLLVEDAPFLRYAFGRLLRLHGFDVAEATDGQEALDAVATFHPQLVLTDLMMPVMDGVELIRRLRADPETADLPVVAITADATEQAEAQARDAGAVDFITKPIDLPALLDRLSTYSIDPTGGAGFPPPAPAR